MLSVLFVCVHNACRSQMAGVIAKNLAPKDWNVNSAGTNPSTQVDPKAVQTLKERNLEMNSLKPKSFDELPQFQWDYVVGMGCGDKCPWVPAKKYVEWDIPDPQDGPMELYEDLFEDLTNRIQGLIKSVQRISF